MVRTRSKIKSSISVTKVRILRNFKLDKLAMTKYKPEKIISRRKTESNRSVIFKKIADKPFSTRRKSVHFDLQSHQNSARIPLAKTTSPIAGPSAANIEPSLTPPLSNENLSLQSSPAVSIMDMPLQNIDTLQQPLIPVNVSAKRPLPDLIAINKKKPKLTTAAKFLVNSIKKIEIDKETRQLNAYSTVASSEIGLSLCFDVPYEFGRLE